MILFLEKELITENVIFGERMNHWKWYYFWRKNESLNMILFLDTWRINHWKCYFWRKNESLKMILFLEKEWITEHDIIFGERINHWKCYFWRKNESLKMILFLEKEWITEHDIIFGTAFVQSIFSKKNQKKQRSWVNKWITSKVQSYMSNLHLN